MSGRPETVTGADLVVLAGLTVTATVSGSLWVLGLHIPALMLLPVVVALAGLLTLRELRAQRWYQVELQLADSSQLPVLNPRQHADGAACRRASVRDRRRA